MKKVVAPLAFAAAIALIAGHAAAFDLTPGAGVPDGASSSDAGATAAVSSEGQGLRVFSSNGVNVGTAISTTSGPSGTFITVAPALTFITGIDRFQVETSSAKTGDGKITLAMTDTALRTAVASAQSGSGTPTVR
jgi:hypothetical protein